MINFSILNIDQNEMPFGFGFHPYFKFNKIIDHLYLKLGKVIKYELNENKIPTGEYSLFKEFINYKKINSNIFDSPFKTKYNKLILSLYDKENRIKINIQENGNNLKYFQIYTPPHRNFIALEPMSCNIDVFNNRDGLKTLKPNESFNISIMINFE